MENIVEKKLYRINPVYKDEFSDFINRHAQFGGGAESDRYIKARSFSNVYEFYIYAFFVGVRTNTKLDIYPDDSTSTFWEIENWRPREIVDYLFAVAIPLSDFDMVGIEFMDDKCVSEEIKKIKRTIESYANGGFKYLSETLSRDPDLIDDDLLFLHMLSESK